MWTTLFYNKSLCGLISKTVWSACLFYTRTYIQTCMEIFQERGYRKPCSTEMVEYLLWPGLLVELCIDQMYKPIPETKKENNWSHSSNMTSFSNWRADVRRDSWEPATVTSSAVTNTLTKSSFEKEWFLGSKSRLHTVTVGKSRQKSKVSHLQSRAKREQIHDPYLLNTQLAFLPLESRTQPMKW